MDIEPALWIPIAFTALALLAVDLDIREEVPEKCKTAEDWVLFGLALLVKPGLFIAVIWWLFLEIF